MQHGTGREVVADILENIVEHLEREGLRGRPNGDVLRMATRALGIVQWLDDFDKEDTFYGDGLPVKHAKVVKYLGPTGSIRDTRPKDLGR